MTHPDAIVIRERRPQAPTRRLVYHALATGGAAGRVEASEYGAVGGSGSLAITTE